MTRTIIAIMDQLTGVPQNGGGEKIRQRLQPFALRYLGVGEVPQNALHALVGRSVALACIPFTNPGAMP